LFPEGLDIAALPRRFGGGLLRMSCVGAQLNGCAPVSDYFNNASFIVSEPNTVRIFARST
jgi:hypothetical protein